MLKVAITHDVDRVKKSYHYLTKALKALKKRDFKMLRYQISSLFSSKNPYWTFDELLLILDKYKIKSTFFFLNESIRFNLLEKNNWSLSLGRYNIKSKKIKDIILKLRSLGHEIGVHGSFNSYQDYDLLVKEKLILEEIVNDKIFGTRQHHLNMNEKTWEIQKKAGFKYDSTWGSNTEFGIKEGKVLPFNPFDNEFTVFPMTIMDNPFVNSKNKWEKLDELLNFAETNNHVVVLNWHTDSLNENEFPNYKNDLIKIIEKCRSKNAKFYTLSEIYKQSNN